MHISRLQPRATHVFKASTRFASQPTKSPIAQSDRDVFHKKIIPRIVMTGVAFLLALLGFDRFIAKPLEEAPNVQFANQLDKTTGIVVRRIGILEDKMNIVTSGIEELVPEDSADALTTPVAESVREEQILSLSDHLGQLLSTLAEHSPDEAQRQFLNSLVDVGVSEKDVDYTQSLLAKAINRESNGFYNHAEIFSEYVDKVLVHHVDEKDKINVEHLKSWVNQVFQSSEAEQQHAFKVKNSGYLVLMALIFLSFTLVALHATLQVKRETLEAVLSSEKRDVEAVNESSNPPPEKS